jgi:hypothetical protein
MMDDDGDIRLDGHPRRIGSNAGPLAECNYIALGPIGANWIERLRERPKIKREIEHEHRVGKCVSEWLFKVVDRAVPFTVVCCLGIFIYAVMISEPDDWNKDDPIGRIALMLKEWLPSIEVSRGKN